MIHKKYFEIMKQFLRGYNKEIYGRELIKKVNISQKNIALTLNELEKEGILTQKTRGNIKHFLLNKNNSLIKRYLILAEIENSIIFLKKNLKINDIFEKIDKNNALICIFGSYAKGIQKKDSDLDIFIVGNVNEKELKKISDVYNINISIKKGDEQDFIELLKKNNPLINEILENHIIISGYEKFVNEVVNQKWQV